jgi:hypothetical protein
MGVVTPYQVIGYGSLLLLRLDESRHLLTRPVVAVEPDAPVE